MTLPKYKDLRALTSISEIEKKILKLQKRLFVIKLKQSIDKTIKPNTFSFIKRQIAQLKFKKTALNTL